MASEKFKTTVNIVSKGLDVALLGLAFLLQTKLSAVTDSTRLQAFDTLKIANYSEREEPNSEVVGDKGTGLINPENNRAHTGKEKEIRDNITKLETPNTNEARLESMAYMHGIISTPPEGLSDGYLECSVKSRYGYDAMRQPSLEMRLEAVKYLEAVYCNPLCGEGSVSERFRDYLEGNLRRLELDVCENANDYINRSLSNIKRYLEKGRKDFALYNYYAAANTALDTLDFENAGKYLEEGFALLSSYNDSDNVDDQPSFSPEYFRDALMLTKVYLYISLYENSNMKDEESLYNAYNTFSAFTLEADDRGHEIFYKVLAFKLDVYLDRVDSYILELEAQGLLKYLKKEGDIYTIEDSYQASITDVLAKFYKNSNPELARSLADASVRNFEDEGTCYSDLDRTDYEDSLRILGFSPDETSICSGTSLNQASCSIDWQCTNYH